MNNDFFNMANMCAEPLNEEIISISETHTLKSNDNFIIDLGNYFVGYFSFKLAKKSVYLDAPVRLKIRFCERKSEIADDYTVCAGNICSSWLQEEIITVDKEGLISLPRRYACRYIFISVLASPQIFNLSDFKFKAVSAVKNDMLTDINTDDKQLIEIDKISTNTLKNCMQSFFEDGPKRDRRLWIGDLRLEALTNYYTFKNNSLVKKCLLYFAASDCDSDGFLPPSVFIDSEITSTNWQLIDYALLYVCCVCDYLDCTADAQTVKLLYDLCENQLKSALERLDFKTNNQEKAHIDWCPQLKKNISLYGICLYTLQKFIKLTETLGYKEKVSHLNEEIKYLRQQCFLHFFDKNTGMFLSELDEKQKSIHSQIWMILGDVGTENIQKNILLNIKESDFDKQPLTPYMYHYVAEAYDKLCLKDECIDYIKEKWGQIKNVDTYPEVFSLSDPDFSPYNDRKLNSMCHAWSCTPSYFIRKYL